MNTFEEEQCKELLKLCSKLDQSATVEITIRDQIDKIKQKIISSQEKTKKMQKDTIDLIEKIENEVNRQNNYEFEEEEEEESETEKINEIILLEETLRSLYEEKNKLKNQIK